MQTPKNKYQNVNDDDPFEGTTARLKGGEPLDTQVDLDAADTEYFTKLKDSNGEVKIYIRSNKEIFFNKSFRFPSILLISSIFS